MVVARDHRAVARWKYEQTSASVEVTAPDGRYARTVLGWSGAKYKQTLDRILPVAASWEQESSAVQNWAYGWASMVAESWGCELDQLVEDFGL